MTLKWFSVRQEGAVLPLGRTKPEFYFRFTGGVGGVGAFMRRDPGGSLRPYQIGQVPLGNGLVQYRAALNNTQSGLPLRFDETDGLDFLSIGRTPFNALDFPTLIRTNGIHVTNTAALAASFGTVILSTLGGGRGSYLMASGPAAQVDHTGAAIPAGIHRLTVADFEFAPPQGYGDATNGEFAPLETLFSYPEGSLITPLHAVLVKNIYYLVERDDAKVPATYRLSTFGVSKKNYKAGPTLPVTPLGINHSESDGPALTLLAFATAGVSDNLYQVDPATGAVQLLVPVAVNDPLDPFKRQGLFYLGRDPSSSLDQFVVQDTAYLGLTPDVEQNADGNWFVRRALTSPTSYLALTAERGVTSRDGSSIPDEQALPTIPPGDPPPNGYPKGLFPPHPRGSRDLPTSISKWIPYYGPFTSKTFNTWMQILFGRNGRIRGMSATPNAGNTQLTIEVGDDGGALMIDGIGVFFPASTVIPPVAIVGGPPYALTAYTPDENIASPVTFTVEPYIPAALTSKAILKYSDSTGFNWTDTPALGLGELSDAANTKQFTDEEEALLISRDGPIDVADTLHRHRVPIPKEVFEAIFNHDYDKVPHPPKATPPVDATRFHTHDGSMSDFEAEALTARGGITAADSQHTHGTLPTSAGHAAVFGGPLSDANDFHTHPEQGHGVIANPNASKKYVPQNIGTGVGLLDANLSTFTGSLSLVLGESTLGSGVNRIVGIRYKEFALFMHAVVTSAIGGGPSGSPAVEITETFGPDNPSGVLGFVPFNTIFSWRGIAMRVTVPDTGAVPFTLPTTNRPLGDFFSYHGIIATTVDRAGTPATEVPMQERFVSKAAPRWVVVLDDRFPDGAYLSIGLS